jgi:hypothetical protein
MSVIPSEARNLALRWVGRSVSHQGEIPRFAPNDSLFRRNEIPSRMRLLQ